MKWYLKVLKQYADFKGRARRKEYWLFLLFNLIFTWIVVFLDNILELSTANFPYGPLSIIYMLGVLIPALAVVVRRLHDTGKSGWMIFIAFIPIIGGIWLLILMLMDSEPGSNQYGENPKGEEAYQASPTPVSPIINTPSHQQQTKPNYTPPPAPAASTGRSFPVYTGGGVCDSCNQPLLGVKAYIVPNHVFYSSPLWRAHYKQLTTRLTGRPITDMEITAQSLKDHSPGSAICHKCIYMFQ